MRLVSEVDLCNGCGVAGTVFKRVGHGGASALAPANSLASFDAAADAGIDMIEFDVLPFRGELILAHTWLHARFARWVTLDRALTHLSQPRFGGVELNVDAKHPGCEEGTVAAVRAHGLLGRTLVTSQWTSVVDRVRELEPRARVGISVGGHLSRRSQRWRDWRGAVLRGLTEGRFDALMAQHRLVGAALVDDVRAAGGELYTWTVKDERTLGRLAELGVDGITAANPFLFHGHHPSSWTRSERASLSTADAG